MASLGLDWLTGWPLGDSVNEIWYKQFPTNIVDLSISCELALRRMSLDPTDDKSIPVKAMDH